MVFAIGSTGCKFEIFDCNSVVNIMTIVVFLLIIESKPPSGSKKLPRVNFFLFRLMHPNQKYSDEFLCVPRFQILN